jgi:hypothetical protein
MYDLPIVQLHGDIYLTKREIDFYSKKYPFNKPILALQTSGSAGDLMYNWTRDIPPTLVQSIIKKYENDFAIVHIKNEKQITYDNVFPFTDNIRAVAVMIYLSKKRIFMDSCCQHISSCFGLSSNVFWVTTSPNVFGYGFNNNIIANKETKNVSLANAYMSKYDFLGKRNV